MAADENALTPHHVTRLTAADENAAPPNLG
jgi:hypothetical protein